VSKSFSSESSTTNLEDVLAREKHIEQVFAGKSLTKRQAELFAEQIAAIDSVKMNKIVRLIPNLIFYLDYPRDEISVISGGSSRLFKSIEDEKRTWPAFAALVELEGDSIKPLRLFIISEKEDPLFKLSALIILKRLDRNEAQRVSVSLRQHENVSSNPAILNRINRILNEDVGFFGLVYDYESNHKVSQDPRMLQ